MSFFVLSRTPSASSVLAARPKTQMPFYDSKTALDSFGASSAPTLAATGFDSLMAIDGALRGLLDLKTHSGVALDLGARDSMSKAL
jgi:hypothetical protein